ncbi:hypothetical protein CJ010_00730 [Azoarcus sp. DD4]|uniref:hypothetical protein n=1 Tax=Azoarcus sp. DD4 TaxID=2027405 RepID=UPI00112D8AEF|nr:hypothetical protein [Azoarcus sp. DD4]QDF95178.1 hypothetical protein CJ010_00730 [Azoarcus sp. DD4]
MTAADTPEITCRKCWWKSRTLWFNVVCAGLIALEAVTGQLQPLLPANVYALMCVVLPVGNAMLRVVTAQGLKL